MRRSGILYLSFASARQGFDVDIYDSTFGSQERVVRILRQGPPGVLGIYANLMTRRNVLEIIAMRARSGMDGDRRRTRAGELRRASIWTAGADVVVAGEGEIALEQLAARRTSIRRRWRADHGIIFRARGRTRWSEHGAAPLSFRISMPSPGRTASASRSTDIWRLAAASRQRLRLADHGARLPVSLQLVQPFRLSARRTAAARRGGGG